MLLKNAKPGDNVLINGRSYIVGEDKRRDMLIACYDNDGYLELFSIVRECQKN